jgi:hypothetical protein
LKLKSLIKVVYTVKQYLFFVILTSVLFTHCGPGTEITREKEILTESLNEFSNDLLSGRIVGVIPPSAKLKETKVDDSEKKITLIYNKDFSYIPFRKETVDKIYRALSERIPGYTFSVESMDHPVEDFIPNYYRDRKDYDLKRQPLKIPREKSTVQRSLENFDNGLLNKNIVLWHSHGWYYSNGPKRWEWQRPRLFQSVEDLIPLSFTVPYLIPMLENAGANVFVPRERDFQVNEVIVDNSDKNYQETFFTKTATSGLGAAGYGHTPIPYTEGVNPFRNGDTRYLLSDSVLSAQAEWIPDIPGTGSYAVYISYANSPANIKDAVYTVKYYGGTKDYIINQRIGGGTWIYLGTFKFLKGSNAETGKVTLNNISSEPGKTVSADAVRFGGGMGIVERNGNTSGRAKFFEGARYWLQAAGMPDTLVYDLNKGANDYNDDYQSRGEYANYLKGAPYGPNRNRDEEGLGIPVDLSLSFHTDAGITYNDTTVGTLAIYSLEGADSQYVFPDSVSRLASRDLSDIIQSQIVDDMRILYDPAWSRRQLREAQYSESFRPNMPGMLLELLSHQNFLDMQFVLDPRFRFDVARAIYKGMLRFLSSQYEYEYVVQPLPVKYFSVEFSGEYSVAIKWKSQADTLEPTAVADKYILYTRVNDEDFNSGEIVYGDSVIKNIEPGKIYSYKVTAVNGGGESFPSEILAAGIPENRSSGNVLVVNGFDRISGPEAVNSGDFAGLMNDIDDGVPDKYDFGFTGRQYDYKIESQFVSNDAPGHGASYSNYETTIIAGNSFDYPYLHGRAILASGYAFTSMSDESFGQAENLNYRMIDYILGEEKETGWQKPVMDSIRGKQFKAFTPDVTGKLTEYLNTGGNLFISGAYLGTELYSDTITAAFARDILNLKHMTTHASGTGQVIPERGAFPLDSQVVFNTTYNDSVYAVTAPGSIGHTGKGEILLRYAENQFSAAAGNKNDYGVVGFGFPFETLIGEEVRTRIMQAVMSYLGL